MFPPTMGSLTSALTRVRARVCVCVCVGMYVYTRSRCFVVQMCGHSPVDFCSSELIPFLALTGMHINCVKLDSFYSLAVPMYASLLPVVKSFFFYLCLNSWQQQLKKRAFCKSAERLYQYMETYFFLFTQMLHKKKTTTKTVNFPLDYYKTFSSNYGLTNFWFFSHYQHIITSQQKIVADKIQLNISTEHALSNFFS